MSTQTSWDDLARVVTTTVDGTVTDTRPYTAEENAAADMRTETAAHADLLARIERIESHIWPTADTPATPDDPAIKTFAAWSGVVPAGQIIRDGSKLWRNVSGVPLTTPPSGFAGWSEQQLAHLWAVETTGQPTPEPTPGARPWTAGIAVQVGDRYTHAGALWEAKIAHTTHDGWAPSDATHAVWTRIP